MAIATIASAIQRPVLRFFLGCLEFLERSEVSELSEKLARTVSFNDFCALLTRHEEIMSRCLEQPPLKSHFPDFQGAIKSLGAWGGDFFLAATEMPEKVVKEYFNNKGLDTVIKYCDIVLGSSPLRGSE